MKNKLFYSNIIFLLIAFLLFTGCGGKSGSPAYDPEAMPAERQRNYSGDEGLAWMDDVSGTASASGIEPDNRNSPAENPLIPMEHKLIKQAELSIEADQSLIDDEGKLSGVNQKIDELMKKYRAYSEKTWSDENSARFTIRVPEIYYESLIAGAGALGKIRSRSETAEDVTIKFYDLEGRLNTRKTLLSTFQGYISRAKDIDDIMKIETRIADLQNEIDRMGSQLTLLSNMVEYATVELYISSPFRSSTYTLGERIGGIVKSFGGFASGALLVLLSIVIYGIPIVLFCLIVFWLLFGRVGILKKAFSFAMGSDNEKQKKQKVLLDSIKPDSTNKNNEGNSV